MKKYNTIYATREEQEDRIRRAFGHPALKPHNNSLKLIFETVNDVGGYIDESAAGHQYDAGCFAIRFKGASGIQWRITVNYRSNIANLLAERFDEIDFDDEQDPIGALMHAFRNMMDFAVHWYDFRDGDWEHVCIHESRENEPSCWPGDNVASTVMALSNDLRTAFEPPMNTLRREMREAYPVAWSARQTPPDTEFSDVVKYVGYLTELANSESKEDAYKVRARALEDLFDEEVEEK